MKILFKNPNKQMRRKDEVISGVKTGCAHHKREFIHARTEFSMQYGE